MTESNEDRLITLEEFIIQGQNRFRGATGELSQLLRDIGLATKIISREVNKAGITNILGYEGSRNVHGEYVKKLDVFSNDQMLHALSRSKIVSMVVSEEDDDIIRLPSSEGRYIVYMDPLDGSSNIDVDVSVGTIFAVYMRRSYKKDYPNDEELLQPGDRQVAAGYVLYGSSTILVYTTGNGVHAFTLDPSIGEFILSHRNIEIPQSGAIYSVNEGYYTTWPEGLKKYIQYCKDYDPDTGRPYSCRYIGSMVSDFHRNLILGGIFMYPESITRPQGKLRLMYECNPLALIMEQAGGLAVNGKGERILALKPEELHQKSPIYIGSKENVTRCLQYMEEFGGSVTLEKTKKKD